LHHALSSNLWQNLRRLTLGNHDELTLNWLCQIPLAKQLRSLTLPLDLSNITALRNFPLDDQLQEFILTRGNEYLQPIDFRVMMQELSTLPFRPTLKRLVLSNLNIGDAGLGAFARGEVWIRLRSLVLDRNIIGDSGWRDFVRGRRTPELQMLSATHNVIGNDGANRLGQSPLVETLEYLDLRHNRIGGSGAIALARQLAESKLKKLLLTGNPISPKDAAVVRSILGDRVD
jgi:hypothetical protein